jgi:hypothetical protein
MTGLVEVLEIERVVPGLVVVRELELLFAALELNGEDGGTADNNGVDPASEAWDLELQEDRPGHSVQGPLQDLDLLFPGISLLLVERKGVCRGECPED